MSRLRAVPTIVLLSSLLLAARASGQRDRGEVALRQAMRDANNDRVVAIIGAHPDDRWMLPAAYLRFHLGFRVAVVLFTRGEGGQNVTGPEVGDALGRIRTLETEASAEVLDCDIWYLNRTDGGYCRTGREALELWDRESTIRDLARLLRRIGPDIVLTTHDPTETHGHDHGLLEVLSPAVELACDWEADFGTLAPARIHRLLRGATDDSHDVSLPADTVDVVHGVTFREIAYSAFKKHASQRPFRTLDSLFEPEVRLDSLPIGDEPGAPSLADGLPSLFTALGDRLDAGARDSLRRDLETELTRRLGESKVIDLAIDLRNRLLAIEAPAGTDLARRAARRIEALERVVQHAIALQARVEVHRDAVAVAGESLPVTIRSHFAADRVSNIEVRSTGPGTLRVLEKFDTVSTCRLEAELDLPADLVDDAAARFVADTFERPLELAMRLRVQSESGVTIDLELPLVIPIEIRPAVELTVFPRAILVPDGVDSVGFAVRVRRNTQDPIDGSLVIKSTLGVQPRPMSHRVSMAGETLREYRFRLKLPPGTSTTKARVRLGRWSTDVPLHRVSVQIDPGLRVGLIRGADDTARSILRGLGVQLVELTDEVLPTRDLSDLDTILVDIRALRPDANVAARAGFNRLIDFVRDGGRLVVMYHKDQEFNLESSGFRGFPAELPLHIGKGRVTREDQPVSVLAPEHTLLNHPNRIRSADWDGWAQERGLYFPDVFSDDYERLLSMADPGESEETGSLLYARAGDGEFVYCALALYRQLKNSHEGACRLFANLVSKPTH